MPCTTENMKFGNTPEMFYANVLLKKSSMLRSFEGF